MQNFVVRIYSVIISYLKTECSETSAYKIQTPGNYPEESMQRVYNFQCSRDTDETRLSPVTLQCLTL